ncbi:MAG: aminotransferase class I/II-fold pyridoxal phosphate-dependent enzyme [Bacteroidia bacterium]|nr:aminotransferase class I/II-fold pyridoxal phosphate-dependent enzyme [Bacteroidia bacterium]
MKSANFSKNISSVKLSPIVSISELVRDRAVGFREQHGEDFVYFQRGEIAYNTPAYIVDAAKKALDAGFTRYPRSGGENVLKQAIVDKLTRVNGAPGYTPENVLITYGGQEALQLSFKLFEGRIGAGFSPCWSCVLENFVPFCDIDFRLVPLNRDFSVDWEKLETVLKDVDFFYLNTPQNPTGKVFTEAEVRRISDLCKANGAYLISDEAYERIMYDQVPHFSPAAILEDHIISCYTFSKAYAMTGWRIGYVVSKNPEVIRLGKLGDYSQTAGVVTFLQHAAAEAITNVEAEAEALAPMLEAYEARRDLLFEELNKIPGISVDKPQGAFYFFPDFGAFVPAEIQGEARKTYIFERLLEAGVAVVYGSCFGDHFTDNVRISFSATDLDEIRLGIRRIREAFVGVASNG